jgi:hypothetical protein
LEDELSSELKKWGEIGKVLAASNARIAAIEGGSVDQPEIETEAGEHTVADFEREDKEGEQRYYAVADMYWEHIEGSGLPIEECSES